MRGSPASVSTIERLVHRFSTGLLVHHRWVLLLTVICAAIACAGVRHLVIAGVIVDRESSARVFSLEAPRYQF